MIFKDFVDTEHSPEEETSHLHESPTKQPDKIQDEVITAATQDIHEKTTKALEQNTIGELKENSSAKDIFEFLLQNTNLPYTAKEIGIAQAAYKQLTPQDRVILLDNIAERIYSTAFQFTMFNTICLAQLYFADRKSFLDSKIYQAFSADTPQQQDFLFRQVNTIWANIDTLESLAKTEEDAECCMHEILDTFRQIMFSIDNKILAANRGIHPFLDYMVFHAEMRCKNRHLVSKKNWPKKRNFFLQSKYNDLREMNFHLQTKPDSIQGISGGNHDGYIYSFAHIPQNYTLRQKYGFFEGHGAGNLLLPISDNYLGLYDSTFRITKVYKAPETPHHEEHVKTYVQKHSDVPKDIFDIYTALNDPHYQYIDDKRHPNWTDKDCQVAMIQCVMHFLAQLKQNKISDFIFDIDRFDLDIIHPVAISTMVHHNNMVLQTAFQNIEHDLTEIPLSEFLDSTFPDLPNCEPAEKERRFQNKIHRLFDMPTRKKMQDIFGITIEELPLWMTRYIFEFLEHHDAPIATSMEEFKKSDAIQPIIEFINSSDNKRSKVIALTTLYKDPTFIDVLLPISQTPAGDQVFSQFEELVVSIDTLSQELHKEIPDLESAEIFHTLLKRGKHFLKETQQQIKNAAPENIEKICKQLIIDLQQESKAQSLGRSFFIQISEALKDKKEVDLVKFRQFQNFIFERLEQDHLTGVLFRALENNNSLAPIPEIHWRVDRSTEEYTRRYGFDLVELMKHFKTHGQQITLECGPGSGVFKEHLYKHLGESIETFALCNKLYYPLETLIFNLIDFEKLQKKCGSLTEDEQKTIASFLYRILVIQAGQTHLDNFEYDQHVITAIEKNARAVYENLQKKAPLLKDCNCVPQTISTRDNDGNVVYPYKIQKPESHQFHKACDVLSQNIAQYLHIDNDSLDHIYQAIPAYSPGNIISDFSDLTSLQNEQIDYCHEVRALVYIRGESYENILTNLTDKLTKNGLYVGDSIRDNDGWYYRIKELLEVQKKIGHDIYVVIGPAFKGEDFNQNSGVPMASVITQDLQKIAYIQKHLKHGFELIPLNEIAHNEAYLKSLDTTGKTFNEVQRFFTNNS